MDQKNGWGSIHYAILCYDDPGWTILDLKKTKKRWTPAFLFRPIKNTVFQKDSTTKDVFKLRKIK